MADAAVTEAAPGTDERKTAEWWTEADDAELAALTWELVDAYFDHREDCERCRAHLAREPGSLSCPNVTRATAVVVDWQHARQLRSYARWVRHQRDLIELEEDVLVHRLRGTG